jgi:pimeloyl-ACP methyl ester carboxylesterase
MTTFDRSSRSAVAWETRTLQVCSGDISLLQAGQGMPLLVLPRDNGHAPQSDFIDWLAGEFRTYYPWLPGFHGGHPEGWEWLTSVRDLAIVLRQLLGALDLEQVGLVGLGFGGWVAAEMAAMGPERFSKLVLVAPMGIQPRADYILDQFLISTEAYARAAFSDEMRFEAVYGAEPEFDQLEGWETDREMTSRLAWKPYMYNPTLPQLLAGVAAPSLVVWGDSDHVVPAECGTSYRAALPNATLDVMADCGHAIDLEQPDTLGARVSSFLRNS